MNIYIILLAFIIFNQILHILTYLKIKNALTYTVVQNYSNLFVVFLSMEAVGVEPTSENISKRLSPSADHNLNFALSTAYGQAEVSASFGCSA